MVLISSSENSRVVPVEGFWSVLRLQAMTIPSVALTGLTISNAQIRLLSEGGIRLVIVMLDGDEQGQAAMETIVPKLSSHFFTRSIILPDGAKPDDVETSVLNEVKALCAGADIANIEAKSLAEKSPKPLKKPKKRSTAKRNLPDKSYALPTSSVSASFGWTGMD